MKATTVRDKINAVLEDIREGRIKFRPTPVCEFAHWIQTKSVCPPWLLDHSKCCASTGVHEGLTFGQGELDRNGYWSVPCEVCARSAEHRDGVPVGSYWPFVETS